jgi:RND family efflux transporter MFP subunit
MKAFSRIQAPFDGIVTARNVDVGTLINSGNGGPSKALFSLAQSGTMRIFVNVPQAYLSIARPGATAELRVQELPGQVFQARVDRTSGEVDSNSRTLLTILVVPNPKGILVPGMYAQIRFAGATPAAGSVLIPGEALVLTPQGTRVGVVDASHRVRFRDVKVGNDYGSDVEILSGVAAGDLVILNPTDAVKDGVEVETRRTT